MMQSIFWTGRVLSRAIRNGISNLSSSAELNVSSKKHPYLVSVVCGFPKDIVNGRTRKGQFGDDAWFSSQFHNADVIGVADGVGGWRAYGIDPGEFSSYLMKTCERLVQMGHFKLSEPADLLAKSYYELLEHKKPILGSSTACVMILDRTESVMRAANIGDSGYMVVRGGRVVHRSHEQQHYFNTPYQLSLPPPGHDRNVLSDSPESADTSEFPVECGDVILVATDGVFDNVPEPVLLAEMRRAKTLAGDSPRLQAVANSIAWMARNLSFDGCYMSPFAKSARQNGIDAIGGKPDDITVLLAIVAL
ncbi:protein phosphatase PTC7 homolog [Leguminivora glycinivorella]|uniref:protein phosphatase PTC7 homolog n=1 Tax=Leguminivora glycinivorella TaxID=1035111 RepID=UPI002010461D|nr:protein phosphatase PTC7 homolog [Leguminivora glycinivorella]